MPQYDAKDFSGLVKLEQFSDELMKTHLKLYEAYVTNTNRLQDELKKLRNDEETRSPQYAGMRRRFGWEFNGMRLHEIFFGNLTTKESRLGDGSELAEMVSEYWGGFNEWKTEFTGIGGMRGIGWVCLYYDPAKDALHNVWIDEHDTGQLAGCWPVLMLDVFEHAFMRDFGTDKGSYMKAFFECVDWGMANDRLMQARQRLEEGQPPVTKRR